MSRACSMHVGIKDMYTVLWFDNPKERDHSKDLGIGGSLMLMALRKTEFGDVDWIHLTRIKYQS